MKPGMAVLPIVMNSGRIAAQADVSVHNQWSFMSKASSIEENMLHDLAQLVCGDIACILYNQQITD